MYWTASKVQVDYSGYQAVFNVRKLGSPIQLKSNYDKGKYLFGSLLSSSLWPLSGVENKSMNRCLVMVRNDKNAAKLDTSGISNYTCTEPCVCFPLEI